MDLQATAICARLGGFGDVEPVCVESAMVTLKTHVANDGSAASLQDHCEVVKSPVDAPAETSRSSGRMWELSMIPVFETHHGIFGAVFYPQ